MDEQLLVPRLWSRIGVEGQPTLLGNPHLPGRLYITTRDFARFGWLYLHDGRWGDEQLIPAEYVRTSQEQSSSG